MPEVRKVSRSQIRAAEILNDMGRGNAATRAIANAKRSAPPEARSTTRATARSERGSSG